MAKIRKAGDILLEMEPLLLELVDHNLQHGDILGLIKSYLEIHCPGAKEIYTEGGSPIYYYGPKEGLKDA